MSTYAEKPDKPLNELLTSSMVHIYVSEENTHWTLHERLLCYFSPFFRRVFYSKDNESSSTKAFGLPETDDAPFELFVGWLYSRAIRPPSTEKEIGSLLDLYFLAQTLEIEKLESEVVDVVRTYYHSEETYPGLRRVQYVYANTSEDNEMREMMVGAVARYLTLGDAIPAHWENALKRNGQLSLDIIRSIQHWNLEGRAVPDVRDMSQDRGRAKTGFSAISEGNRHDSIKEEDEEDEEEADGSPKPEEEESHAGVNGDSA